MTKAELAELVESWDFNEDAVGIALAIHTKELDPEKVYDAMVKHGFPRDQAVLCCRDVYEGLESHGLI